MSGKTVLIVFSLLALSLARNLDQNSGSENKELGAGTSNGGLTNNVLTRRIWANIAEQEKELIKVDLNEGWATNKLSVLSRFLSDSRLGSNINLTLVGWQRIVDNDGRVKDVNLVILVIPAKSQAENEGQINNDDLAAEFSGSRRIPARQINELRQILQPLAQLGVPASVTYEALSEDGEEIGRLYLDQTDLEINVSNFTIRNRTIQASPQEIDGFLQQIKNPAVSVIRLDSAGGLVKDTSIVTPLILGGVKDFYQIPDEILLAAPGIIAKLYVEVPQELIAQQLGVKFNKLWPQYQWRVLQNVSDFAVTRDVSVTLAVDNVGLDENSTADYFVWGVKKTGNN